MSLPRHRRRRFHLLIALLLGALLMPLAHTTAERAGELDARLVTLERAPALRTVVYDFRSVLQQGSYQALPLIAKHPGSAGIVPVGFTPPPSAGAVDADLLQPAQALEDGGAGEPTLLDDALMILFGIGLLAYQLGRKQRLLQHTTLATGSF